MSVIVTGSSGFLGKHVMRLLPDAIADVNRKATAKPKDTVIHLAAVCGGIGYNKQTNVAMLTENLRIGLDAFERFANAKQNIYVSTTCMYPENCQTPFAERDIWQGRPEHTNAPYGIAKRAISELFAMSNGMVLIPSNLYGPGDHYVLSRSHVIPALVAKFVEAKNAKASHVTCWGDGTPTRDFLYVEDCAQAIVSAIKRYRPNTFVNLGSGVETSIHSLATVIAETVGYAGEIYWDESCNGQQRRLLYTGRGKCFLDWQAATSLEQGIKATVEDYLCRTHLCR